ncbi:MAG: ethanolamine utilization microcompartment protein EutL [Bdellovibrionales bacterium]
MNIVPVKPKVLSVKLIPDAHKSLLESFSASPKDGTSLGLITCDMDDALYAALDECTKASQVNVIFAKSFYAGSGHSSGPLSGEVLGIIHGSDNQSVQDGINSCLAELERTAWFYKTTGSREINFFPHVISSLGYYLSKESGLKPGDPMAYLIAPPIESVIALDCALKAAEVKLVKHFKPPTETNFGGAYLTGSLDEVEASAKAFAEALCMIAERPFDFGLPTTT